MTFGGGLPAFDPSKMPLPPDGCPPPGQQADFAASLTVSTDSSESLPSLMELFGMMLKRQTDKDAARETGPRSAAGAATFHVASTVYG
jgi:hypothetical protein